MGLVACCAFLVLRLAMVGCRYVVLNRPWAFVQWLREVTVPEKYIFMSEPDHIWLKPMPNLMLGDKPAAFPFFYIEPAKADYVHITEKFTGKLSRQQLEAISPIGAHLPTAAWTTCLAADTTESVPLGPCVPATSSQCTACRPCAVQSAGNAPTLLTYSDLKKVAETWMNTSHAIFDDEEAHKVGSIAIVFPRSLRSMHHDCRWP